MLRYDQIWEASAKNVPSVTRAARKGEEEKPVWASLDGKKALKNEPEAPPEEKRPICHSRVRESINPIPTFSSLSHSSGGFSSTREPSSDTRDVFVSGEGEITPPAPEKPSSDTWDVLPAEEPEQPWAWLANRLVKNRRISELISEWCGGRQWEERKGYPRWEGGRDGDGGHWIADLNRAREELFAEVYEGPDNRLWWRLPVIEQAPPLPPPDFCPTCQGQAFWRNSYDVWMCEACFTPTLPEMVKEWIRPQLEAA